MAICGLLFEKDIDFPAMGMRTKFDNISKEEIDGLIRKYSGISYYFDEEFRNFVSDVVVLVREHASGQMTPVRSDKESFLKFAILVHEGWKKAQNLIADRLIFNLSQIENLSNQVTDFHMRKDYVNKKLTKISIRKLKMQNLVLRRIVDCIVWTIFRDEHSTIRRMPIVGGESNFSIENINYNMPVVNELNKNPETIAICADITTFVHSGDILKFNLREGVQFIELKSGDKNIFLTKIAKIVSEEKSEFLLNEVRSSLADTDFKQFERIRKQFDRHSKISTTINTGKGEDHNTGATVRIVESEAVSFHFTERIVELWKSLSDHKKWAIAEVDRCLYIGIYKSVDIAFAGFEGWMAGINNECDVYNLMDCFRDGLARPFFHLDLPLELLLEVFKGELVVAISLDLVRLVEEINSIEQDLIKFVPIKKKKDKIDSYYDLISHKKQNLVMKSSYGDLQLGTGILTRIIYDFECPIPAVLRQLDANKDFQDI